MNKDNYNLLILSRIEKYFNYILYVGAIVAWLSAFAIYLNGLSAIFIISDVAIGVVAFGLALSGDRVSMGTKVFVAILMPIYAGILSFTDGGFASGTITLFVISNGIASLLLTRKQSLMVGLVSCVAFVGLWIWSEMVGFDVMAVPGNFVWTIQLLLYALFLVFTHVAVFSFKVFLIEKYGELDKANEKNYHMAYYDAMTGLPNSYKFLEELKIKESGGPMSGYIVIFNLTSLNLFNSIYGMVMGDRILTEVARCFSLLKKEDELLARIGGNDIGFWIDAENFETLDRRLDEVKSQFFDVFDIEGIGSKIEYKVCFAGISQSDITVDECYHRVHTAVAYSKQSTQRIIPFEARFEEEFKLKTVLRENLRVAIRDEQFEMYYQKQIDSVKDEVIGFEALARWFSPVLGPVRPDIFVEMIDQMGMAVEFGQITVKQALKAFESIIDTYGDEVRLSINISPSFLMDEGFAQFMELELSACSFDSSRVILEVTENVMMDEFDKVNAIFEVLQNQGFEIALDDFGSGYASLNYLSELKVNELKIDKSLVFKIIESSNDMKLIEMVCQLTEEYKLRTIAEGVEQEAHRKALTSIGCRYHQGYLYAKPVPLKEIISD